MNEEQACHDKAATRMAYLNAVIQCLKTLGVQKTSVKQSNLKKKSLEEQTGPESNRNVKSSNTSSNVLTKEEKESKLDNLVKG